MTSESKDHRPQTESIEDELRRELRECREQLDRAEKLLRQRMASAQKL
jgi:hypothetical protein